MQWGKDAICAMQEFTWLFIVLILRLRLAAGCLNVNSRYQMLWHCSKSMTGVGVGCPDMFTYGYMCKSNETRT